MDRFTALPVDVVLDAAALGLDPSQVPGHVGGQQSRVVLIVKTDCETDGSSAALIPGVWCGKDKQKTPSFLHPMI